MESSWTYQLNLVVWQLFLHLSFAALSPSFNKRRGKCEELIWKIAGLHGFHLHDLPFVIRFENGDRTGRPHCHAVLAGLPKKGTDLKSRMVYRGWARKLMGNAHINPFRRSLPGVAYITEGLSQHDPGTAYEVSKFGTADAIYVSPKARMEFLRARAFGRRIAH
jgi:hypothetical protein